MALLEIDAVRKCYSARRGARRASASRSTSHEVVCLIGASGSGKSTLLRCINGLETIEGGEIRFEGDVVSGPGVNFVELRRRIGLVFQSFNLFPHMSVMRNVTIAPIEDRRRLARRGRGARAHAAAPGRARGEGRARIPTS